MISVNNGDTLEFKWSDNMQDEGDINDFSINVTLLRREGLTTPIRCLYLNKTHEDGSATFEKEQTNQLAGARRNSLNNSKRHCCGLKIRPMVFAVQPAS